MVETKKKEKRDMPLTDREKERFRQTIPIDKARMLISNLNALIDTSEIFNDWEINYKTTTIKDTQVKVQFRLKSTSIEKEIEDLDPHQKKMDDFVDPDSEEDIEED